MPYVPSEKTIPPADDRKVLDPVIEAVAKDAAEKIDDNSLLTPVYKVIFFTTARHLASLLAGAEVANSSSPSAHLAEAIYKVSKKYGYWGAHQGELNYSITRFIQRVPQIMVKSGKWQKKDELRYWVYASTVSALTYAENHTADLNIGVEGVFEDIKDEYKWRVNRAYEMAQIRKSGDCYDTPWLMKQVEVVDESGTVIGYIDVAVERSEEVVSKDVLECQLVMRRKPQPSVSKIIG